MVFHAGFTMEQKALGKKDFTKIPGGLPGVQTRGTLLYTYGVREGKITQEQMCKLLSENPAKLYGVYPRNGVIAPGSDADIVVWNPDTTWSMTAKAQQSACDYCPMEGTVITGRAEQVYLRGTLAAENGTILETYKGHYITADR